MRIPKNSNAVISALRQAQDKLSFGQAGIQWFLFNMLLDFVHALRGNYFIDWIPACAGMTNYFICANVTGRLNEAN